MQMFTQLSRPSQTKIIATIGPACEDPETLSRLIQAGVDIIRINSAHATLDECATKLSRIRQVSSQLGVPVAVLLDLAGPKFRLGQLVNDQVYCRADSTICFVPGEVAQAPDQLVSTYPTFVDEIGPGDRILLADGTVSLVVESVSKEGAVCRVLQPGIVRSRQGINVVGIKFRVRALTEADRHFAHWAAENEVDFLGLSFVRYPEEIRELKALLQSKGSHAQVVAKIEKAEALDNLEAIVAAADAVMIARGDLGVETDIAQLGVVQKRIIRVCRQRCRPVIVATQMLDSMQRQLLPTRAEVSDVANAIIDGADACMLSGETAVGQHPVEAVTMMHRIALATEEFFVRDAKRDIFCDGASPGEVITEATVEAAVRLAAKIGARLIAAGTATGVTVLKVSRFRLGIPIVGISDCPGTLRRMCLYWGVLPVLGPKAPDPESLLRFVVEWGRKAGMLGSGDRLVVISGTGLHQAAQNVIIAHQID